VDRQLLLLSALVDGGTKNGASELYGGKIR
jgi:hypothetical protein